MASFALDTTKEVVDQGNLKLSPKTTVSTKPIKEAIIDPGIDPSIDAKEKVNNNSMTTSSAATDATDSATKEPHGVVKVAGKSTRPNIFKATKNVRTNLKIQNASKITQEQIESKREFMQVGWDTDDNSFNFQLWILWMSNDLLDLLEGNNMSEVGKCFHAPECKHDQELYALALNIKSQIETDGELSGPFAIFDRKLAGSNNVQNWAENHLKERQWYLDS